MAKTNAERQATWRERQKAEHRCEFQAKVAELQERIDLCNRTYVGLLTEFNKTPDERKRFQRVVHEARHPERAVAG